MLLSFLTGVGTLLFISSIILLIVNLVLINFTNYKKLINQVVVIIMMVSGGFLLSADYLFFYARPGMSYLVQYINGTQNAVLTPGFHTRWFGEVIPFKKYVTVAFLDSRKKNNKKFSGMSSEMIVRFNDSVTADVALTARFELPSDEKKFKEMAVAFRTQDNLINTTMIPLMQEVTRNSARMFSAQEYIGGKGGDFENAISDQIENGLYLLEVKEHKLYSGKQAISTKESRTIETSQTVIVDVRIKKNSDGNYLRKHSNTNPIQKFGIKLVQSYVQKVDPDPKFKEKLQEQRDKAAQVAIERQGIRMQEERKKNIIAKGEADKAQEKAKLEQLQIKEVIAAETKAKMAEQDQIKLITEAETKEKQAVIQEKQKIIELRTARLEGERIKTLADAESEKRRKLMSADNALSKRLEAYVQVNEFYAQALQNKNLVPQVVIGGSGENGQSASALDLVNLITSKAALDLGVHISEKESKE